MNYLLDTNILLVYLRNSELALRIDQQYTPLADGNIPIISVVTIGELQSLALRNHWGTKKLENLQKLLNQFVIADINVQSIIDRYAQIDAFSQGKLSGHPVAFSARNMGKNDLWIAATTSVLEATLLTLDKDFDHLKDEFLNLERIELKVD